MYDDWSLWNNLNRANKTSLVLSIYLNNMIFLTLNTYIKYHNYIFKIDKVMEQFFSFRCNGWRDLYLLCLTLSGRVLWLCQYGEEENAISCQPCGEGWSHVWVLGHEMGSHPLAPGEWMIGQNIFISTTTTYTSSTFQSYRPQSVLKSITS